VGERPGTRGLRLACQVLLPLALVLAAVVGAPAAIPPPSGIQLTNPPTARATVGSTLTVRGTVSTGLRRHQLLLERKGPKGWITVAARRAGTRGAFAFPARLTAAGSLRYRVVAGTARRPLRVSRTIVVTATVPAAVSTPIAGTVAGTTVLPIGVIGTVYRVHLATGVQGVGSWAQTSGSLPPGLTLDRTGLLAGTPTASGTSSFAVTYTEGSTGTAATRSLALVVDEPPSIVQISGACDVRADGTVACWGSGTNGLLGVHLAPDAGGSWSTVVPIGLTDAVSIATGGPLCAVRRTGAVVCLGLASNGELGDGSAGDGTFRSVFAPVTGIADAVAVSTGIAFGCVLRRTGSVLCWGTAAQLGGSVPPNSPSVSLPAAVPEISDAIAISSGQDRTCALHAGGTVSCWGTEYYGDLGEGGGSADIPGGPVTVAGLTDAAAISVGRNNTCALRRVGSVVCWGAGRDGTLGDGRIGPGGADSNLPVPVSGIDDATAIAVGVQACALRATGTVACWGPNARGELGNGTLVSSGVPVPVVGLSAVTALSAADDQACAVTRGRPWCWGDNDRGAVGVPEADAIPSPVPVIGG
jgi:alpha-tubulin suppressor-like RCC1 family protein